MYTYILRAMMTRPRIYICMYVSMAIYIHVHMYIYEYTRTYFAR